MDINATLFGQLITFLVLVWFTMKYIWPPITKIMADREKKIALGLESAAAGVRELEQAKQQALTILHEAKVDAAQIVDAAHKRSMLVLDEAKAQSKQEGLRLIEQAREEIVCEVAQAKEVLRKQFAALAVSGAEKILQRNLDASSQTALLNEFVAEL